MIDLTGELRVGKISWYKRDPNAALAGMANLTLEECGAYNRVLDLIYAHDGAVEDDVRYLAGWMRCDVRVWKRIRARLLELGKLYVHDGTLRNSRADAEVDEALRRVASAADVSRSKGRKSGATRRKNNDLSEPTPEPKTNTTTSTTTTTEEEGGVDARAREPAPLISPEADRLADECLRAVGLEPKHPPPELSGLTYQAQVWIARGYDPPLVIATFVQIATAHQTLKPLNYFCRAIEGAHEQRASGTVVNLPKNLEDRHERDRRIRSGGAATAGRGQGFGAYALSRARAAGET